MGTAAGEPARVSDRPQTVVAVAGVRPQYIKLAALSRAFAERPEPAERLVRVNAGQHYSEGLARQLWDELGLRFDVDLTNRYGSREPMRLLGEMMTELHEELPRLAGPKDWVVAFGDANTTLATALAAKRSGLRLAHVEAGARTGDNTSPEEQNALLADHVADARFISTRASLQALRREGITANTYWAGDLHYDLVRAWGRDIAAGYADLKPQSYVLCAIHHEAALRNESLIRSLTDSTLLGGRPTLFIEHPRTKALRERLRLRDGGAVVWVPPLTFRQMLGAMKGASFIVTDSGGVQREAHYLGRPSITVGGAPFWPELVDLGASVNVRGFDATALAQAVAWADELGRGSAPVTDEFGDGHAGERIRDTLRSL